MKHSRAMAIVALTLTIAGSASAAAVASRDGTGYGSVESDDEPSRGSQTVAVAVPALPAETFWTFRVNAAGKLLSSAAVNAPHQLEHAREGLGIDARSGIVTLAVARDEQGRLMLLGADSVQLTVVEAHSRWVWLSVVGYQFEARVVLWLGP